MQSVGKDYIHKSNGRNIMKDKKTNGFLKQKNIERLFIFIVLLYPMLQFAVMYIGVNANSILLAFKKYDVDYNVSFAKFDNFKYAFKLLTAGEIILIAAKNSMVIFVMTLIIGFPLNMLFSYYIFKKKFASSAVRFIILLPSIVSNMVMGLMFVKFTESVMPIVLGKFGVDIPNLFFDSRYNLGVVIFYILWTGFTSSLIMYPNAMSAISGEIIESAELDGVSELQELWYIIMPLIYPTITTYMVTGVAGIFSFQGPLFIIYNYEAPTNVYNTGYYLFKKVMAGDGLRDYPNAAAAGLLFTLVSAPLTLGIRKIMDKFGPQTEE